VLAAAHRFSESVIMWVVHLATLERKELVAGDCCGQERSRDTCLVFRPSMEDRSKPLPDTVGFELIAWIALFWQFLRRALSERFSWSDDGLQNPLDGETVGELIEGGHGQ